MVKWCTRKPPWVSLSADEESPNHRHGEKDQVEGKSHEEESIDSAQKGANSSKQHLDYF
jgi:hypothetical protein